MRKFLRHISSSASHSTGSWLMLLLLFVVLVPSIGLVWILNEAVQNEQLAIRQKLIDAYRVQLVAAQDRLEAAWRHQADESVAPTAAAPAATLFANLVRTGAADAVVCYDTAGHTVYPDSSGTPALETSSAAWNAAVDIESSNPAAAALAYAQLADDAPDPDAAARALQAQARSLLRAGDQPAAITILADAMQAKRLRDARDRQGRLLALNADLMALELLSASDSRDAGKVRDRLAARVLDYEHTAMPAAQRRFLLRSLQRLPVADSVAAGPGSASPPAGLQLLAAEDLAAAYVESRDETARDAVLRTTNLPGVWQQAFADGRIVRLHRTANLAARLQSLIGPTGISADVRLDFIEPGHDADGALLSLPAGPPLPGWRLALAMKDPHFFASATSERVRAYVWIVALVVFSVVVLALLALGLVRRQVALTQLRNDLVANVTHELKTPLASMRLLVETLLNTERLNEQTTREYLQLIATENLRLSRLIGNFLTFSRIERNKYTFDFKTVPVHAIVHSAVAAVGDRFQLPDVRFDVAVAPDLPAVTADADAIVTALVNLLDNAWKYSGDRKQIALTASAHNGSVAFAVRDHGIGLAPRDVQRIFQRFYQVRQSQSTGGGGSGLGLSIVQFIVSAHHGSVSVDSEPGRGSTFTITLPAAEARDRSHV